MSPLFFSKNVRRSNVHSFVLGCLVFSGDCILQTAFKLTDTVFLILDLTLAPWIFPPRPVSASPSSIQGLKVEKTKKCNISSKIDQFDRLTSQKYVGKSEKSKKLIYSVKIDHYNLPPIVWEVENSKNTNIFIKSKILTAQQEVNSRKVLKNQYIQWNW